MKTTLDLKNFNKGIIRIRACTNSLVGSTKENYKLFDVLPVETLRVDIIRK